LSQLGNREKGVDIEDLRGYEGLRGGDPQNIAPQAIFGDD